MIDTNYVFTIKHAIEHVKSLDWGEYPRRYWSLGFTLWESIKANQALLDVFVPNEPHDMKPRNYAPCNPYEFTFVVRCKDIDNPQSPIVIGNVLEADMLNCEFDFDSLHCNIHHGVCIITINTTHALWLGRPMSNAFGHLTSDYFRDARTGEPIKRFDIDYPDGSTHGGIPDNTKLIIFHEGRLIPTKTARDEIANSPYLTRIPVSPRADSKYLASVSTSI